MIPASASVEPLDSAAVFSLALMIAGAISPMLPTTILAMKMIPREVLSSAKQFGKHSISPNAPASARGCLMNACVPMCY